MHLCTLSLFLACLVVPIAYTQLCSAGTANYQGNCFPCPAGCDFCTAYQQEYLIYTTCLSGCSSGQTIYNQTCIACPSGCDSCSASQNGTSVALDCTGYSITTKWWFWVIIGVVCFVFIAGISILIIKRRQWLKHQQREMMNDKNTSNVVSLQAPMKPVQGWNANSNINY